MKVVVFSQYFWPENFRINDLVKSLLNEAVDVDVITAQPNYPQGRTYAGYKTWKITQQEIFDAPVHRLPIVPRGNGSALRLILNYLSFVISGTLLAPFLLRRKQVDVVFVYAISPILQVIPAIVLKWVKGAKLVVWVQDLWPDSLEATGFVSNRWLLASVRMLVRWIYRQADLILVQSEAFVAPVAELADRRKIVYYPNSADDVFLSPILGEPQIAGLEQGFSIVFAGNLGTAQAVETIVAAAALLKDQAGIRIFLVGDGSRSDWIKEQIQCQGLSNIVMVGRYPLEAMPAILHHAGALLVTLKDEPIFCQTVPSKVQAYLAMGRPIIACINGEGARIVVEGEAGISCPAEDPAALAAAICAMANMGAGERDRLGMNGRRYFQTHYDSAMLTQTLISHFDVLLRAGQAGT